MQTATRNTVIGLLVAIGTIAGAIWFAPGPRLVVSNLPAEIDDQTFWQMVTDLSEPGGAFTQELMSNEDSVQSVIPALKQTARRGGLSQPALPGTPQSSAICANLRTSPPRRTSDVLRPIAQDQAA